MILHVEGSCDSYIDKEINIKVVTLHRLNKTSTIFILPAEKVRNNSIDFLRKKHNDGSGVLGDG